MTSTEFTRNRENYCYRHPDRQSFVLCQRCLRTVCPECQTQAAVGVICPECLGEQRHDASPAQRKAERRWARPRALATTAPSSSRPVATLWIIGITAVVFVLQLIPGLPVQQWLLFAGAYVSPATGAPFEPWRVITVLLVHAGFWHIGFNMLALWMIGRSLEPLLGHARFVALYLISGLGGSVAVVLLTDPLSPVVGASGAIFGLFGALLVIGRHIGANITAIAVIIGINFAIPFVLALSAGSLEAVRISWQAHLGGLIAGAAAGFIYARTRSRKQRPLQIGLLVALAVALVGLMAVPAAIAG